MLQKTKLTNDEFIALRSIGRDPWASGAGLQWKHNGRWFDVDEDGWSRLVGTDEAYRWRGALIQKGQAARALLLEKGLVEEEVVRCCNGGCEHPGWTLTTLSYRGKLLRAILERRAARDASDKADREAVLRARQRPSGLAALKKLVFGLGK